jgi:NAD(P)-dependent dehydrogenase (short-subunit alcohol dehydrogenase family)
LGHWQVYATARKVETIRDLGAAGAEVLPLDVTDESSIQAVVSAIEARHGRVAALVNNAGYSQSGAVETVSMDGIRAQFETNVFGLIRLTQVVLPGMRRHRSGHIINISSMGGRLVFPGGGVYHATKYAVEALSDALRFEVRGFGIKVVVIEPGLIRTEFARTAVASMPTGTDESYAALERRVAGATEDAYERGLASKLAGAPEDVAVVVERALSSARPRSRYLVAPSARIFITLRRLVGDRGWDRFLRMVYPSPGK